MTRTITRLFDSHTEAASAVEALERAGIGHDRISLISSNADGWHEDHRHADGRAAGPGDLNRDGEDDIAEGASKGAATGALLGGGAGLLAGLGILAIPGLGPVVAAGWLVSAVAGATIGTVAGSAAGGLLGALKETGHSEADAHVYVEGVRRGGSLVSVRAGDDDAERIASVLDAHRGVGARVRGEAYRSEGWTGFDASAVPYSSAQAASERARFAEMESFAGPTDLDVEDDRDDLGRSGGAPERENRASPTRS